MMKDRHPLRVQFTDFWHPDTLSELKKNGLYRFIAKWFQIEIVENPDFLFYSNFGTRFLTYKCTRIFYTGENIRPNFSHCDYAFSFDYPETDRNFRLPLYRLEPQYSELLKPRSIASVNIKDRGFCSFVYSNNRAQQRITFFDLLSRYRTIDSGGSVRNNTGALVENKIDFLRKYKFNIAFENSSHPGYTTEKVLHAFLANTVPIYWGNPNVSEDFNTRAMVNCHDYESFQEVVDVVKEIDTNDALYMKYLSEPYFPNGVENQYASEERICAKFRTVFFSNRHFIPKYKKWNQSILYNIDRIFRHTI